MNEEKIETTIHGYVMNLFDANDLANIRQLVPNRNITLENGAFFCNEALSKEESRTICEYMEIKYLLINRGQI